MALTKLGSLTFRLTQRNPLLQRLTTEKSKVLVTSINEKSTLVDKQEEEDDLDKPLVFSTSEAAKWNPDTIKDIHSIPWFQPYWIMASLAAMLIYFCILREENDIDQKLTWDLTDHFKGEAKAKLEASQKIPYEYARNRQFALSKKDIS